MALHIHREPVPTSGSGSNAYEVIIDVISVESFQLNEGSTSPYDWLKHDTFAAARLRLMSFNLMRDEKQTVQEEGFSLQGAGLLLLKELQGLKQRDSTKRWPIIFICYSFGGHIAKDALAIAESHPEYRYLFESTVGVLFLGAIHDSQHPKVDKHLIRCIAAELSMSINDRLFRSKGMNSALAQFRNVCQKFSQLYTDCQTITLFETAETKMPKTLGMFSRHNILVTHDLALLSHRSQRPPIVGVEVDHITMSKFPQKGSLYAKRVLDEFTKLLNNTVRTVSLSSLIRLEEGLVPPHLSNVAIADTTFDSNRDGSPVLSSSAIVGALLPATDIGASGSELIPVITGRADAEILVTPTTVEGQSWIPAPDVLVERLATSPLVVKEEVETREQVAGPQLAPEHPQRQSQSMVASREPSLPCRMIRPYQQNDNFVGRTNTIEDIKRVLDVHQEHEIKQAVFALVGLGGVGKTQTALTYVFRRWNMFQAILWAQADTPAKLSQSFADFAYDMNLVVDQTDQVQALIEVKRWFATTKIPWLVVFDNADRNESGNHDNLELLEDYWPSGDYGSVLITSQDKRVVGTFADNYKELGVLSQEHAKELLYLSSGKQRSKSNEPNAKEIVQRVDNFAFAIVQAGFTIRNKSLSFSDYLLIYDNRKLMEESRPIRSPALRYGHSFSTIWSLQFQELEKNAQALMNIIAFLDPDDVSEDVLSKGALKSQHQSLTFLRGQTRFVQCRANLTGNPLVFWNVKLRVISMHRLVQETCHLRMEPDARQEAFQRAYHILYAVWPQMEWHNRRQNTIWNVQEKYIRHIDRLGEFYRKSTSQSEPNENAFTELRADEIFAELLYHAAWYYVERGFLSSAEPLLDIAKEICENCLKNPELILADIHGGYGAINSERNKLQETLDDFQKQNDCLLKALEKGLWQRPHVREALALGGLAQGYAGLNMLVKAEEFYYKCINAWKDAPGEPTIYQSHLGTCLAFQGKLDAAEKILEEVIRNRAAQFGPCDTTSYRTALLYYALGNVRRRQTRYNEAYEIQRSCLSMFRQTCGDSHHSTADAYYKLAWHLQYKAEYKDAVNNYETALKIYNRSPEYNTEIARAMYMLGTTYMDMGQTLKGENMITKAEELRRSIMTDGWVPATGEDSYDQLVNFWSR